MGGFRAPLYTACQLRNHTHRSISQQPAPTNHHYRTLFSQGFSTCSKFVSPYPYQPSFRLSSPKYGPVMYSLALKPSNCAFGTTQIVKVPSMGDSITEGTLNEWKKSEQCNDEHWIFSCLRDVLRFLELEYDLAYAVNVSLSFSSLLLPLLRSW